MRTASSIDALFPTTRQVILAATFGEPRRWWYMRELATHLRLTPSSLQRELVSLVRGGILAQKRKCKHVYFSQNARMTKGIQLSKRSCLGYTNTRRSYDKKCRGSFR